LARSPDGNMLGFRRDDMAGAASKIWIVGADGYLAAQAVRLHRSGNGDAHPRQTGRGGLVRLSVPATLALGQFPLWRTLLPAPTL